MGVASSLNKEEVKKLKSKKLIGGIGADIGSDLSF